MIYTTILILFCLDSLFLGLVVLWKGKIPYMEHELAKPWGVVLIIMAVLLGYTAAFRLGLI